jgi:hypothetical protein
MKKVTLFSFLFFFLLFSSFFLLFFLCSDIPPFSSNIVPHAKEVTLSGDIPNALSLFRKMPHFFCFKGSLYFVFSDRVTLKVQMFALDLTSFAFKSIQLGGSLTTLGHITMTEGVFFKGVFYLLTSGSSLFKLDMTKPVLSWEQVTTINISEAPASLTGGCIEWNGSLWVISLMEAVIFSLSLSSFQWKKHSTVNPPNLALRDCSLARIETNDLVLIRKSDYSELWSLSMLTMRWTRREAYGLRSGNYSTNPSFAIHDGCLYSLGGQVHLSPVHAQKNHIRKLTLSAQHHTRETRMQTRLSKMFQDDYTDIVFTFSDDTRSLRAHRSILCQHDYFRSMFEGNFSEAVAREDVKTAGMKRHFCVNLVETDHDSFFSLLEFYYERLNLADPSVDLADLYQLADRYLIDELKEEIVAHVGKEVSSSTTALRLYEAAVGLFECPATKTLKRKAEEIIAKDLAKVSKTEEFGRFCKENADVMPQFALAMAQRAIRH